MSRFKILSAKTAAAVLSTAMIFQGTALAAPIDELSEIMEKQGELVTDSLMEETLGLSELGDAIDDNGLLFQIKAALDAPTFEMMCEESGLSEKEAELLKDGCALLGLQVDTNLHKWQLSAGLGSEENCLLDVSLYGDEEQLALSLPQFYAGALALKAGNFKEQLLNSDLATIFGISQENAGEIPEIDMSFYPEDTEDDVNLFGGIKERIEEKAEEIEETLQVEKTESGDVTTYAATMDTSDIMDIYRIFFDEYLSLFTEATIVSVSGADLSDMDAQIDQMLSELGSLLGDSVTVNFDVRDGLVEKISYEMYIDTSALDSATETLEDTIIEETVAAAGNAEDAVPAEEPAAQSEAAGAADTAAQSEAAEAADTAAQSEAAGAADTAAQSEAAQTPETTDHIVEVEGSFQGYITYEFSYLDPAQPTKGMECKMDMKSEHGAELMTMLMNYGTETEGTVETTTFSIDMQEGGRSIYSGTPFTVSFDAATGDLDAVFSVEDENDSVVMKLDSTFTEIEKGKSLVLTIDELSVTAGGEKVGMTSEIKVSSDPGEFAAPAQSRVILDLTQGGLLDLVNEISANAQVWAAQFMPEVETPASEMSVEVVEPEAALEETVEMATEAAELITEAAEPETAEMAVTEAATEAATEAMTEAVTE